MFNNMSRDKLKRMVTGITIAGTLLVVILVAIIVYQLITMGVKSSQISKLEEEIAETEEEISELEDELAEYLTDEALEKAARKAGYVYPDDKTSTSTSTDTDSSADTSSDDGGSGCGSVIGMAGAGAAAVFAGAAVIVVHRRRDRG